MDTSTSVEVEHDKAPQIHVDTEMGYILLPGCSIYLKSAIAHNYPRRKWIDVEVCDGNSPPADDRGAQQFDKGKLPCPQCDLVFHHHKDASKETPENAEDLCRLSLWKSQVFRFQGTLADQIHHQPQADNSPSKPHCQESQRSDAALMLGAIMDAQCHGYASMQTLQLLLHPTKESDLNDRSKEDPDEPNESVKASLVATFAFPSLASTPADNKGSPRKTSRMSPPSSRSIVPAPRRARNSNLKPLPASMQLLLSLIRSDWSCLDNTMQQLQRDTYDLLIDEAKEKPGIFPSKLTLEELYTRIRGSTSKSQTQDGVGSMQQNTASDGLSLSTIPVEILKTQIAPFLRAKSLDSLRCTCKSFHMILSAVVPGLKLKLFQHQINSLQWMRRREVRPISEAAGQEMLASSCFGSGETALLDNGDSDPVRAMTGGQSTWLSPRWTEEGNETDGAQSLKLGVRIDQTTGCEMHMGKGCLDRQGARGGLLCDEPGLGKSITILSLVLQTAGLLTHHESRSGTSSLQGDTDSTAKQTPEEQMFQAYWKEDIPKDFRGRELCRVMSRVKRLDPSAGLFFRPIDPKMDGCEDYFEVIKNPMCFNDIYRKISAVEYGIDNCNFNAFVSDVELCFRNAIEYNPPEHEVHKTANHMLTRFQNEVLVQFKQEQLGSLRSSASNAALKPNSSVAALMQKQSAQDFQKSLLNSSSTLIVIPPVLMDHWLEQIKTHVDFRYMTSRIPLIYEYTTARKSALKLEEALRQCEVAETHCPILFVDKAGTHKLPSPDFLAMFMIVITTTRRFTNEWKNGSFQEEIVRNQAESEGAGRDRKYVNYRLMEYGSTDEEACPLLKVNWLRMLVDEGHAMGRGKGNSAIQFASWLSAQRRWAMTGTPTQQTASQNGLNNMRGLMQFLEHNFFTRRRDGDKVWKRSVARSWKEGQVASFFRLKSLLSLLMIRHTKLDIEELPLPIFNTTVVPMSPLEITTYNTLVSAVQGNLKLTSMKGRTSGEQDSLLNRSQAKHAQLALTNIRRVCCGGTRIVPVVTHAHWVEFIQLCMLEHKMSAEKVQEMEHYLQQTTTEQLSRCYCCGMLLSMLLVLPCGCLLCTECMDNQTNVCVMCDKTFDVDQFQQLQPGLDYNWLKTDEAFYESKKEEGVKAEATPVQAGGNAQEGERNEAVLVNLVADGGEAQDQLLLRPPQERRRTKKPGDGHVCEYSRSFDAGKCILCFEEHNHCKLVNPTSCCQVCWNKAQECPETESKPYYLVTKLLGLYEEQQKRERDFTPIAGFGKAPSWRPLKVIIFSQFRQALDLVGNRLIRRFGTACVAEYWGKYRTAELNKFIHDPDCFCMLLGKDGSEGLDLSFVTHLFFLEAVWDKSLEQQAVARAWRMGATGPVQVETLFAKNSVEERMKNVEELLNAKKPLAGRSNGGGKESRDGQRGKVQFLLKSLTFLPDIEIAPLAAPAQVQKRFGFDEKALNPPVQPVEVEEPEAKRRRVIERRVRFSSSIDTIL